MELEVTLEQSGRTIGFAADVGKNGTPSNRAGAGKTMFAVMQIWHGTV